jgi:hypothetical protein
LLLASWVSWFFALHLSHRYFSASVNIIMRKPTLRQILDGHIVVIIFVSLHIDPKVRIFVESLKVQFLRSMSTSCCTKWNDNATIELKGRVSIVGYSLPSIFGLYTELIVAPAMDSCGCTSAYYGKEIKRVVTDAT